MKMKDMRDELDRIERIGRAKKKKQDLERRIKEREVRLQTARRKETEFKELQRRNDHEEAELHVEVVVDIMIKRVEKETRLAKTRKRNEEWKQKVAAAKMKRDKLCRELIEEVMEGIQLECWRKEGREREKLDRELLVSSKGASWLRKRRRTGQSRYKERKTREREEL